MEKQYCYHCGRERLHLSHGRFIDGSWIDDLRVRYKEAWGKWVCSFACYWEVINRYGEKWETTLTGQGQ
jgi:hypothetical protein